MLNVAILSTNSLWSAVVLRLAGVRRVVGYRRDGRGLLLSDAGRSAATAGGCAPISTLLIDHLQWPDWLGCDSHNRAMQLGVTETDEKLADGLWSQVGFSAATPTIAINSGAANSAKRLWLAPNMSRRWRLAWLPNWELRSYCIAAQPIARRAIASQKTWLIDVWPAWGSLNSFRLV